MKNYKNVLSFVLVLAILVTVFSPLGSVVKAESQKDQVLLEISDLKVDIKNAVQSVQDIEPKNADEKELLDKYHEAAKDINRELEISEERVSGAVQGIADGSVYDLTTIPVRIQLLIRIGRAIRFATTELSNKVVAAHTKIAEYILTGILYVVNPFASEGQIVEYMEKFEALQQELLQYPDLRPEDIATIYKKAAFSRELSEARRVYNSQNSVTKQFRARPLKEAIDNASRMWWRIDVTCGELDAQVEKVHAEMEKITGPKVRVDRIEFMEGPAGYITIDKKTRIRPVIFPNEVKNKDVIIYSANPYIARVSAGEIIPQKTGSTEIIVIAKDNNVQGKFTLYVVEQGGYMDQIPPLQATGQNYGYDLNPNPNPGHDDQPPIQHDKTIVKSVDFATDKITMTVGDTYDLSAQALVYPVEAVNKSLSYTSENDTIATVDKATGQVKALHTGLIRVFATSDNGVMGSVYVEVKERQKEDDIQIISVENTQRRAGIFCIEVEALNNGRAYNGYMTVELTSGNKTLTKKVYMSQGKGRVKFNGLEFYVWLKDFHAKVTIKDQVEVLDFSYGKNINAKPQNNNKNNYSLLQKEYDRAYESEKLRKTSNVENIDDVYSYLINNPDCYYIDGNGHIEFTTKQFNANQDYFYEFQGAINNLVDTKQIIIEKDLKFLDISNARDEISTRSQQIDLLSEADSHIRQFENYIMSVSHGLSIINHTAWWIDKVKSGGVWDYKSYLGYNKYYDVLDLGRMSGETIGNFHYGYVGRFYFSERTLLFAGDLYQGLTSDDWRDLDNYQDSYQDKRDIKWGCREYLERR